ncbi:MAG: zinc metallopeptidase [Peptoniphilaceae bacterium]|nr:zinc metallopeptidase [Peptoniphilaceae bacterium]MDY6018350.1 zinc metallopeptidase [Anaerococcus sp.]
MYPFYFDRTYFLVLIGIVISMLAQANIQKKFSKYEQVKTQKNITGLEVAQYILRTNNYNDIKIKKVGGSLSDYFNPISKEVALSDTSLTDTSIASVAVAAHECGHVIQYKEGFIPLKIKSFIVPAVNFGSSLSMPAIFLGLLLSSQRLLNLGIILFSFMLIFQLVTLPVEFDASRRALNVLEDSGMLVGIENDFAKDMLKSAALTYVAAALATALQFLRLLLLFGNRDRRDD